MGTVGLSFGSATSGAGFDVATTVSAILGIQQGIETPWKNQIASLQAQDAAFTTIGSHLSTLSTALQSLTDFEGVTAEKNGSSSDPNTLALTSATPQAAAGSHEIIVKSLAQTSSVATTAIKTASDTLSGGITIQVGSGTAQTFTVDSSSNTLQSLAAAINHAGIGVTASLITDTTGTRLSLVSGTNGAAGQLTVSGALNDDTTAAAIGTQVGHNGVDASLTVDGIEVTSASNTVTNAIAGVTFQLLNTSTSTVQVQITNNLSDIGTAMSAFVTAYNAVFADIKGQEGKDASGKAQPLYGDPTLALLQNQLSQGLLGGAKVGGVSGISQLGITINQDGTLTYSNSTLTTTLNSNFSDAVGFLQNVGGFGLTFSTALNSLSSTKTTGAIYLASNQNSTQEAALTKSIANQEARVALEKVTLTKELNLANQILQGIPDQLNQVNEIYSAITGYKGG